MMNIAKNRKLKIMHILPTLGIGGMETVLVEMLQLFDKERFMTCVCSMGNKGELAVDLEKASIPVFSVEKFNKFDIFRVWRLAQLLKREKIDVVHTYSGVYRDGAIAARLAGVPVTLHTDQGKLYSKKMLTGLYHRVISNYLRDKVIAVSEDLKNYLSKTIGIRPSKIIVIPNAVRTDRILHGFDRSIYRHNLGLSAGDLAIGIVARLVPVKDHSVLLEASAKVFKAIPNAKLFIVGDGPLKNELKSQANRLGINNNVIFTGKRRDISQILSSLDVFVLSSKHEGISLSILEAMVHSLPAVATRVGGNPALVDDHRTGLLVESGKADEMANAIIELLTDNKKRTDYGTNAREKVVANFDLTKIVRRYEDLYTSYFTKEKKINIMHLASNPEWAGAEVHLATLADSLKNDNRVEISVTVFHNGKLVDYLKGRGIRVNVVPLKWLFDVTSIFKVARLLKENDIGVIHTHGYKANFIGALASLLHKKTKCIRTEHGLTEPFSGFNKAKMNLYETLDYLVGRLLTKRIISVSDDIKNNIANKYPKATMTTIHNGIMMDSGLKKDIKSMKKDLSIPENIFVIGMVGRLALVKGHEHFINAAKLILQKRQDVRFLIIGDGPLRQALEQKVTGKLNNYIKLTGFRDDVKDLTNILDIVVFSSLSEGIPYTLLEAMSLGKPVVATRVGGLVEVISSGKNGLLVNSQDEKDIAEKCLYLLENKEIMQRLGGEGRKTIKENFLVDKMKEETIRIYEEVMYN
jgi:sugar transferase (PEP-CTERM/EpsH1 system associated)